MTIEELQKRLNNYGELWGCRKDTVDKSCVGWITIIRRKVASVPPVDPDEEPERFAKWKAYAGEVKARPYLFTVYEVTLEYYKSERYISESDYCMKENYYLTLLTELPELLAKFGKTVDDLLPQSELLAP